MNTKIFTQKTPASRLLARDNQGSPAAASADELAPPSASVANALLSGYQWNKPVVSFSFPDRRNDYASDDPDANGMTPSKGPMQHAIHAMLTGASPHSYASSLKSNAVSSFTNLAFSYAGKDQADIRIATSPNHDAHNGANGWAYYPELQTRI